METHPGISWRVQIPSLTLQGTHLPTAIAGRGFLTAKGLCWEERKLQWMLRKEGQTQCPRHFWRTWLLNQWPLVFIQRDKAQATPGPIAECWAPHLPQFYSRGLPCHPQCPSCTALKKTDFLALSLCSRVMDQPQALLLSDTEPCVTDTGHQAD